MPNHQPIQSRSLKDVIDTEGVTVVNVIPTHKEWPRSKFHDLFVQITDGRIYRILPKRYLPTTKQIFQTSLNRWCAHRQIEVTTRSTKDGVVFVKALRKDP